MVCVLLARGSVLYNEYRVRLGSLLRSVPVILVGHRMLEESLLFFVMLRIPLLVLAGSRTWASPTGNSPSEAHCSLLRAAGPRRDQQCTAHFDRWTRKDGTLDVSDPHTMRSHGSRSPLALAARGMVLRPVRLPYGLESANQPRRRSIDRVVRRTTGFQNHSCDRAIIVSARSQYKEKNFCSYVEEVGGT